MAGRRTLHTTLLAALTVDAVANTQPGGDVYLPPPAAFVTTWSAWFVLGIVAGFGAGAQRLAGQLSVLILLTKLVLSARGPVVLGALDRLARAFPVQSAAPATPAAPAPAVA